MAINLSNLKPATGSTKRKKRVGRGGKRGTYSGRGLKGQKSRSGGRGGLKALGFKQTLQRIPKKRGFNSPKAKLATINLSDLDNHFQADETVDAQKLLKAGLIKTAQNGVKVLAKGQLSKKLHVIADNFSQAAEQAITAAGGRAEIRK
ncbi:MAG TPA: 50S ribosomal protein L15 [bacterium]|nr:50S ribosomal protein L15 [bacterium]HNZ73056.1 50S ribosomal protein L15 [bacterium]HPN81003.1 50S ribosomal protein L15 [bacterium]HPW39286.1 50S ribosomal protein L15 [bacterium]